MSHLPRQETRRALTRTRGFTLVEIIVVIIIIAILATLIVPRLIGRVGQAKTAVAGSNASSLANYMQAYILDCGLPPPGSSLQILMVCPSEVDKAKWQGPYLENKDMLIDPWGKPFMLVIPGKKNATFDIVSYGADGIPGGDGENADIIKP